jgi:cytochrome P450
MTFLEQYDSIDPAHPEQQMGLFFKYVLTDPDTMFAELRAHRPIFAMPSATLATRFEDVEEILSRPTVFSVRLYQPRMDPSVGPFMLARDATEINRRDKSIMMAMLSMRDLPLIAQIVTELADAALKQAGGTIELISQLSRLVPIQLTGRYFGFSGPDTATMFRWSRATQYDMFHNTPLNDPKVHQDNLQAGAEMRQYLTGLMTQRREELKANANLDDTLSRLLKTVLPPQLGFANERILTNMMGLLVGGVETTSAAAAQVIDVLLSKPEQLAAAQGAAMAGNRGLLAQYVWEALRFNPINPFVFRFCESDYELASGTDRRALLKAGTVVLASTRSAMMDDGEVDYPEEFRLTRPAYHYLHFGYGHHACLGEQVGTVEIPILVERLLLRRNLRRAPGDAGQLNMETGPFPESFSLQFDA